MASEFATSVDYGLQLSRRLYYGKGVAPPPFPEVMSKSEPEISHLPTAVMAYAVVAQPSMVDNPDVPSYQPYVHGRCDPPALIPLHMHEVCLEVDCCLDTAFVTVTGLWRVHCIMTSKRCDCRIAVPMGEQGSLLGVEVDIPEGGRCYSSKWIAMEDTKETGKVPKAGDGRFLKQNLYTFKISQVEGGSYLSIKVSWSQKLLFQQGRFCLNAPFTFPAYVIPTGKRVTKKEKILLKVNSCIGTEISCQCTSHPIKELSHETRKLSFVSDATVKAWSNTDFNFSYAVSLSDITGGVLLQSPPLNDFDAREMFCFYLFPGNNRARKVFRKEVVFVIDYSGSMQGSPIESVRTAILASLSEFDPEDSFNIIAFDSETRLFSSKMEKATHGSISNATQWLSSDLTSEGSTNILLPIQQAVKLLSDASDSIPLIYLITDGAVEDERDICSTLKDYLKSRGSLSPRISTFGIGRYCNHIFLQMLAQIGHGHYDCSYDADSIGSRLERLFTKASSIFLANITTSLPEHLDVLELFPSHIPDLSFESPLIVSGRYKGDFPDYVKVSGTLADMTNFQIDLKVQNAKDVALDKVNAKQQIDTLTAQAWFSKSEELQEKVAKLSVQTSFPSEYTVMVLLRVDTEKKAPEPVLLQDIIHRMQSFTTGDAINQKIIFLGCHGIGFGNLSATVKNRPAGSEEPKAPEGAEILVKAASNCCGRVMDRCCCMCCIQTVACVNDRVFVILSQICAGLACFACFDCCIEVCGCL